jgi:hypothetical protein
MVRPSSSGNPKLLPARAGNAQETGFRRTGTLIVKALHPTVDESKFPSAASAKHSTFVMPADRDYIDIPSQDLQLGQDIRGIEDEIRTRTIFPTAPTLFSHSRMEEDGLLLSNDASLEMSIQHDNGEQPTNAFTTATSSTTMTVDEAIERLGMGYFQLVVLTAAGLCFSADAMQILLLSFLSPVLRLEWNLTDDETALITSILFFGAIFGTLTLGPLADRKGRKPVFLLSATIISSFGIAVALVTNYSALLACLFMVGWGVGGLTGE